MKRGTCSSIVCVVFLTTSLMACTDTPTNDTESTLPVTQAPTLTAPENVTQSPTDRPVEPPLTSIPTQPPSPTPAAGQSQLPTATPIPTEPKTDERPATTAEVTGFGAEETQVVPCNHASPANPMDITIPDGASLNPGESFSKIWRLVNTGSCTWTTEYSLVWFSGERFNASSVIVLLNPVQPGQSVDLVVDMQAPEKPGVYQSNWKFLDPAGQMFGIGPNGDAPFWVKIAVNTPIVETSSPSETPTTPPLTAVQSQAILRPGEGLDLDTNQVGAGEDDDLFFSVFEESSYQLSAVNGSLLSSLQEDPPSSQTCLEVRYENTTIVFSEDPQGYACFLTNQGLPGRIQSLQFTAEQTLMIEFLTWTTP